MAEQWLADAAEAAVLEQGAATWERLHERIAQRFGRAAVRARVRLYLTPPPRAPPEVTVGAPSLLKNTCE